jgi:hypothetical protein
MTKTTHDAAKAILTLAGVEMDLRADGYVPMSFLHTGGKRYKDLMQDFQNKGRLSQLLEAEAAKAEISALATSDDFSARGLIEVNTKTKKHFRGFLHPRAALVIATQWFKPQIASDVITWYYRFISGDASLVHDVADRVDLVHGTKSLLTRTVADKEESDEVLAEAHVKAAQYQAEVVTLQSQLRDATAKLTALSVQTEESDEVLAETHVKAAQVVTLQNQLREATVEHEAALSVQTEESTAEIDLLSTRLTRKSDRLTVEVRKRRRMCEVVGLNDAANEATLAVNLMQLTLLAEDERVEGPGEQPSCNSMPARFIALRGVNEATNGREHKIAHALVKDCLAAMGENLMKFQRANGVPRARLVGCITAILDEQAMDNPKNPLTSNVFLVNLLCANLKRVHGLKHATHLTLGALYGHVRRANRWFEDRRSSAEFQLVQESDLAVLLGYEGHTRPNVARYDQCDIRLHFPLAPAPSERAVK